MAMILFPRSAATFSIAGPGAVNVGTPDAPSTASFSWDMTEAETAVPPPEAAGAPQAETQSAAVTQVNALRQRTTASSARQPLPGIPSSPFSGTARSASAHMMVGGQTSRKGHGFKW